MSEIAIQTAPLHERVEYAKALSPADLLPPAFRGKPANVLLAMEAADSLGKKAMDVIQNAHVINGKIGFSAEFQRALVLEAKHKIRVFMDGDTAVAQGVRRDDPEFTYEVRWDMARAKSAGLGTSDNWKKHAPAMLKARATTELCRDAFADVIRGYRSAEELWDIEADQPKRQTSRRAPGSVLREAAGLPKADEPETIDAEIIPNVTDAIEMITDAQVKKLHTAFTDQGFKDREDRLAYVTQIVGIDVESSKNLTKDQASRVIDALESLDAPVPESESEEGP